MGTAATAQINVRIDRELKEAGDRELARLGISPSEMVRAVWEKLARGGQDSAEVRRVAVSRPKPSPAPEQLSGLDRIDKAWDSLAEALGISLSSFVSPTDDELEEARYQHLLER